MADGFIGQINHTNGRRQDHTVTGSGDEAIYRLRTDTYFGGNGQALGIGDLTTDAWGVQKVSLPYSIFHGMWPSYSSKPSDT